MREEGLSASESSVAGEATLSLAEGMGFLFEEDLPPISREAAALIWEEFVASADPSEAAMSSTLLLTKFRRPPSWVAAGSAAAGASQVDLQRGGRGAEAGFETSNSEIARQGER